MYVCTKLKLLNDQIKVKKTAATVQRERNEVGITSVI